MLLKLRFSRAGHLFEFPILLSTDITDARVVAGAYALPPLALLALAKGVLGPLGRVVEGRRWG